MQIPRRELLKTAAIAAGGGAIAAASQRPACGGEPAPAEEPPGGISRVDVNVHLSRWPFRRLPLDEPQLLVARLKKLGFTEAWAGSFDAILHRDLSEVNRRLAETCRQYGSDGLLRPVGAVNPALPDWREDFRRCVEVHRMHAVRIYPGYHGYGLDAGDVAELLQLAGRAGVLVQIAVALEDARTQHPLVRIADVDLAPLPGLLERSPDVPVMLINHRLSAEAAGRLARFENLSFDTARVEATEGIERLMASVGSARVMLGTHAPFLIPESALIKVYESNLDESQITGLVSGNARELLGRAA